MRRPSPDLHVQCPCCDLQAPSAEMRPWTQRALCRQLAVLEPPAGHDPDDGWVSGPYRYYYVTHQTPVCAPCYAHLEAGGKFRSMKRNRGKQAFLVLVAIVAILIVFLPILIPKLRSALWLQP